MESKVSSCRILVGKKCNFSCSYCCNDTMPDLMEKFEHVKFENLHSTIEPYHNVVITGGEPLVKANMLNTLAVAYMASRAGKKVYVYTNLSVFPADDIMQPLANIVDGWTVGVHRQSVNLLENLNKLKQFGGRGIRINIEQSQARHYVDLVEPYGVDIKPYVMDDCDISDREDWYQVTV